MIRTALRTAINRNRWIGLGAVLVLCGLSTPARAWWDSNWNAHATLTFDNSGQAQNLSGFPVLVALNGTRVDYGAIQDLGQDLRFVDADDARSKQGCLRQFIKNANAIVGTTRSWFLIP